MRLRRWWLCDQAKVLDSDFTENWAVGSRLLRQQDEWRVRAVEQVTVGSARLCTRRRSLQVAPLGSFVPEANGADSAFVLLPVDKLRKRPLLGFNISVDEKPAYLISRRATADVEAALILTLAEEAGVRTDEVTEQYVNAICAFSPSVWERYLRPWHRSPSTRALRAYLIAGLSPTGDDKLGSAASSWTKDLSWITTRKLLRQSGALRSMCRDALGEGPSPVSSADFPLLAAPLLAERGVIDSLRELTEAMRGLERFVNQLVEQAGVPREAPALVALAEFGRRWQALAWCDVPLHRPFLVKTEHEAPLRVGRLRAWAKQPVALADAHSNHLTLSVTDANVELADVQLRGLDESRLEGTLATGLRRSRERFALYTSEPGRDARGALRFRLRVPLAITAVNAVVLAVSWLAVGLTGVLVARDQVSSAELAVLVVPTTFAASLLLTRERNSLARRLQAKSRAGVLVATAALWMLAAWYYAMSVAEADTPWAWPVPW